MKIALYHNLLSGGAKRALYEMVLRLADQHDFLVETLTCSNHNFADISPLVRQYHQHPYQPSKMLKSPFGRLNQLLRWVDLNRLNNLCASIAGKINQQAPDLLFANPCQFENSPSVLRHHNGLPSVFFCQEPLRLLYEEMPSRPYDLPETRLHHFLGQVDPLPKLYYSRLKHNDQENLKNANLVLVNSAYVQQQVREIYGVEAQVNYLGVDANLFHQLDLPRQRIVLSVGSLTPLKGFDFIIRSLARLPKSERPPFWIASNFSNSPEYRYLTGLAGDLDVEVQFHSDISDQHLVELYNQAAVTVYTPVREPFGLVAIESMACATPVVGVREGGLQETIVDGYTGRLTERDEAAFADAVYSLLSQPDLAREYGENGRQHVMEKWTWRSAAERLEQNFRKVLA
jgi:glycosyltransferase involved in cell wall biosynthesis